MTHKRTRNTIAAEPTPRSSGPSNIGSAGRGPGCEDNNAEVNIAPQSQIATGTNQPLVLKACEAGDAEEKGSPCLSAPSSSSRRKMFGRPHCAYDETGYTPRSSEAQASPERENVRRPHSAGSNHPPRSLALSRLLWDVRKENVCRRIPPHANPPSDTVTRDDASGGTTRIAQISPSAKGLHELSANENDGVGRGRFGESPGDSRQHRAEGRQASQLCSSTVSSTSCDQRDLLQSARSFEGICRTGHGSGTDELLKFSGCAGRKAVVADQTEGDALDTRFMAISAVDKAFKGRRLQAVQARDPHTAAAVRAARAENILGDSSATSGARNMAAVGHKPVMRALQTDGGSRARPKSAPLGRRDRNAHDKPAVECRPKGNGGDGLRGATARLRGCCRCA